MFDGALEWCLKKWNKTIIFNMNVLSFIEAFKVLKIFQLNADLDSFGVDQDKTNLLEWPDKSIRVDLKNRVSFLL